MPSRSGVIGDNGIETGRNGAKSPAAGVGRALSGEQSGLERLNRARPLRSGRLRGADFGERDAETSAGLAMANGWGSAGYQDPPPYSQAGRISAKRTSS